MQEGIRIAAVVLEPSVFRRKKSWNNLECMSGVQVSSGSLFGQPCQIMSDKVMSVLRGAEVL